MQGGWELLAGKAGALKMLTLLKCSNSNMSQHIICWVGGFSKSHGTPYMCYIFGKLEVGFLVLDICGHMVTFCVGTLYNIHRSMDPLCISVRCHAAGVGRGGTVRNCTSGYLTWI